MLEILGNLCEEQQFFLFTVLSSAAVVQEGRQDSNAARERQRSSLFKLPKLKYSQLQAGAQTEAGWTTRRRGTAEQQANKHHEQETTSSEQRAWVREGGVYIPWCRPGDTSQSNGNHTGHRETDTPDRSIIWRRGRILAGNQTNQSKIRSLERFHSQCL